MLERRLSMRGEPRRRGEPAFWVSALVAKAIEGEWERGDGV